MTFVLDASAAASLIFADEADPMPLVERFAAGETALVTTLFGWELANLIVTALRRGRIDTRAAQAQLGRLALLPIEQHAAGPSSHGLIRLALSHSLSAYDAGYLELARAEGVPLATRDRRLADAAHRCGVELLLI